MGEQWEEDEEQGGEREQEEGEWCRRPRLGERRVG